MCSVEISLKSLRGLLALNVAAVQAAVEVAALGGRCRLAWELVPPVLFPGSSNARKCRGGISDLNSEGTRTTTRMGEGEYGSKESSKVMSEEAVWGNWTGLAWRWVLISQGEGRVGTSNRIESVGWQRTQRAGDRELCGDNKIRNAWDRNSGLW